MKVLFLRSNPVDPDSRVEKEVTALSKAGHKVTIFAWDRSKNHDLEGTIELFGGYQIEVYRIGIQSAFSAGFKKNLMPLARFQKEIWKFIRKHKQNFDVIHACDFDTAFAAFCSKPHECKFIYDVFDYYVDSFSVPGLLRSMVERVDTYMLNHSDAVIICTEERVHQLRYAHPRKLVTIHNTPMKADDLNRIENTEHKNIKIAYVGILSYGRNILETCEFVSANKQYELHIGGFGILESAIKEYADKNNNIHFYGKLSYSDTLKLERQCDILIAFYDPDVPNHKYAAPNKFYEALMLGKPVIMAEGTGMSEVVRQKDIGSVVPYSCPEKGFLELSRKRDVWKDMGDREKKLYDQVYSWKTMECRLIGLYDGL